MKPIAAFCLILLLLQGCAKGGQGTDGCAGWAMITLSRHDNLTPDTERQIVSHNEYGVARSCWKSLRD